VCRAQFGHAERETSDASRDLSITERLPLHELRLTSEGHVGQ
jgi:hypothetical protein